MFYKQKESRIVKRQMKEFRYWRNYWTISRS